jgi:hypothetical protein
LLEVKKQSEACRRYGSSQRLAGVIEAARGLQEVYCRSSQRLARGMEAVRLAGGFEATRGWQKV